MDDADTTRVATARRAAEAGAAVAHERFRGDLSVESKDGKTDLVTDADRAAQRRVREVVERADPAAAVVGEEDDAPSRVPERGDAWIVDPIDGTNNYVRGLRQWGTSVAAVTDGRPVAGATVCPALGDAFVVDGAGVECNGDPVTVSDRTDPETFAVAPTMWWDRDRRAEYAAATRAIVERFGDLRRIGCAQATLAQVAAGALDGAVTNVDAPPWDTVAGAYMVERAGGTVTALDGGDWTHATRGLVASNGRRHDDLLATAREIDDVRGGDR